MKLNPDCIRDVLMALEGITDGRTSYTFHSFEGLSTTFILLPIPPMKSNITCVNVI